MISGNKSYVKVGWNIVVLNHFQQNVEMKSQTLDKPMLKLISENKSFQIKTWQNKSISESD